MKSQAPSLVVMAAGMGSRFGGLKQMEGFGPFGQTLLEYSVYDALRAGFGRVVFIVRPEMEVVFREVVLERFGHAVSVALAYQTSSSFVPGGLELPALRTKPWGTGHAVLCAAEVVREPFAVINADDFYGAEAYAAAVAFLGTEGARGGLPTYGIIGYRLDRTVSEHGSVSRAVCETDAEDGLLRLTERTKIVREGAGFVDKGSVEDTVLLTGAETVSLNFWAFTPALFEGLREGFEHFLQTRGGEARAEYYLPEAVDALLRQGRCRVRVVRTDAEWFGVTYPEDRQSVQERLAAAVARGAYPERLW